MDMLYRDLVEFAVGHGVAVNWRLPEGESAARWSSSRK